MQTAAFYNLLRKEVQQLADNEVQQETNFNNKKDEAGRMGRAFLHWFLKFYGQKPHTHSAITDGRGDFSCDLIFSNKDYDQKDIFYVVQSKWLNLELTKHEQEGFWQDKKGKRLQEWPQAEKGEFNASLQEFNNVLSFNIPDRGNAEFNTQYERLKEHLRNNGKVKFIFFTAAEIPDNSELRDSVKSFNQQHRPNVSLELIDMPKIKRDFIEFRLKGIQAGNPLEYEYEPIDEDIELEIERYPNPSSEQNSSSKQNPNSQQRDILQFEGRAQAYLLLLRPATIHALFHKYRFNLFFTNIRNPLPESNYNAQMAETLKTEPESFWYYNNGITALTKLIPQIGQHATKLNITGLQVINGAQTFYTIYRAYEEADPIQRKVMDADVRISLRLVRSADAKFAKNITHYTNSQNVIEPRDFVANDPIQARLQQESFQTAFWYEKRRGEFRDQKAVEAQGVKIIPNQLFIIPYIAFHLQNPHLAWQSDTDLFFVKYVDNSQGLYEKVFNNDTKYTDMLAALVVSDVILDNVLALNPELKNNIRTQAEGQKGAALMTALTQLALRKYLLLKYPNQFTKEFNVTNWIIKTIIDKNSSASNLFSLAYRMFTDWGNTKWNTKKAMEENQLRMLNEPHYYQRIKEEFEATEFTLADFEPIKDNK